MAIYLEEPEQFNPKLEVVGCFLEYGEKILLLHRQENKSQGNTWGVPGGKIEKGEDAIDAAVRETVEETGFMTSKTAIEYLSKVFIKYPAYDYIYHMIRYKIAGHPSEVRINFNEHKGFTWVTPKDALNMELMLDEDPCIRLIYAKQIAN